MRKAIDFVFSNYSLRPGTVHGVLPNEPMPMSSCRVFLAATWCFSVSGRCRSGDRPPPVKRSPLRSMTSPKKREGRDNKGAWKLTLPAMKADGEPARVDRRRKKPIKLDDSSSPWAAVTHPEDGQSGAVIVTLLSAGR